MIQKNKRSLVIVFSICIGIFAGLVIASNFSWTQNSFADNEASVLTPGTPQSIPPINSDLEATSRAFVEIAKRVTPTIVSITSEKIIKARDPFANFFGNDEFFKRFFPGRGKGGDKEFRQNGLGSGIIVSPDGYILTNYHVIKDADELNVIIDKKEYVARVVGSDPETDIAVVDIDAQNLPAIRLGDSDKLEVGELVLAIGSPFDISLQHTVTSGIISAKGRSNLSLGGNLTYQDFIQTDAAINPGNSGGALVNIRGELIGINTAIYAGTGGGNVGIGFAIPVNLAKQVMDDLIAGGKVVRGYLGVIVGTPDAELSEALNLKENAGAVISEVVDGAPADKGGLKKYDVIIEVEGKKIEDHQMLTNLVASFNPGENVSLKIIRDGKVAYKTVRLAERPSMNGASEPVAENSVTNQLGIEVADLTRELAQRYGYDNDEGVLVSDVRRNSVAAEKGLRRGDLVKEVDRRRVRSARDVERMIENLKPGDIVLFQIKRQTSNHFIAMKVPKS